MSLEKDIQQVAKFRNEYHKMAVNIIYTYNWIVERQRTFLDKADITGQQYNILRILRGSHTPLSTLQIRQRMLDKMSDTSRIVDRLIKKGLVKKGVCKSDKRLVDVVITPAGLKMLEELDAFNHELDSILSGLTEEEAKQMNQLLDKLRGSED